MRFTHPAILIALVALPWIWWTAVRRCPPVGRGQTAWRAATALLTILAAAGLQSRAGEAPVVAVVAFDRSASIPSRAQQRALARVNAFKSTMRYGDRLGLVSFGADAVVEWRPLEAAEPGGGTVRGTVSESGTNIGAAIRLARALLPQGGSRRILLVSDGRDAGAGVDREALHAAAAEIPIDVIPPSLDGIPLPLLVTRVNAPSSVAMREPYAVSIEVSGTPGARGQIVVFRDDQVVGRSDVVVAADGTAGLSLTERQDAPRTYTYRARLEAGDDEPTAGSAGAVVLVEGEPAILYVADSPRGLGPALGAAGFRVVPMSPERVPVTAEALSAFAGIVLDDVPAERLPVGATEALAGHVENAGAGLLILGGAQTLTLDGYPATPLGRVLPIDLRPRTGQRATPVELVLVFDKSGSMAETVGGVSKIEVARQAVAEASRLMPSTDAVGVLAFDSKAEIVAPITVSRDEPTLRAALTRVRPGGSTAIFPALETAFQLLRAPGRPRNARRLVLLISDGRTSDDDAARVTGLARTGGVQISAVAIGANANRTLLEELARSTGGRAYFPDRLGDLPHLVAREAARSSAGGVVQERFVPRASPHPAITGIDAAALPPLNGYVVSAVRSSAIAILSSHLDDPILCAWRAGLGRVAVFTADLGSPWSAGLRSWPASARMWTQTVRWLSRAEAGGALRVRIRDADAGPQLAMDTEPSEGSPLPFDTVQAIVRPPAGGEHEITLEPTAPGQYAAPIPVSGTGPYVVAVTARDQRTMTERRVVRGVYWSADREIQHRGADMPLLLRIASLTGGRLLGDGESPFDGPRTAGYADASRWLVLAALVMFLLDVAVGGRRA
jgi:Ca-activated chloride channel homolog